MKHKLHQGLVLFLTFLKIGLFTFGGGYAMIPFIQKEVVEKRKWINQEEIFDILVISESTPGPISVNVATFVGYRVAGVFGAMMATIGLALPSLIIIFLISLVFERFLAIDIVYKAFQGIKVGVIVLILSAIIKLSKGVDKNRYTGISFLLSLIVMLLFSIFLSGFTYISIILIALGLIAGIVMTAVADPKKKDGDSK